MIQIVSSLDLHDTKYPIYVFSGEELKETLLPEKDEYVKTLMNAYTINHANKIVLAGNDILTVHYEHKIREEGKNYAFDNLNIERIKGE